MLFGATFPLVAPATGCIRMTDPIQHDELLSVFRRVCADRGWELRAHPGLAVTESDVAQQMAEQLTTWIAIDGPATDEGAAERIRRLERAAIYVYCGMMHRALLMEGSPEQARSLIEIYAHVLRAARVKLKDGLQAEAAANGALLSVWRAKQTMRDPGLLLAYATTTVNREAQRLAEQDAKYVLAPDEEKPDSPEDGQPGLTVEAPEKQADEPQTDLDRDDALSDLERMVRSCLRSPLQQEVFIAYALRGLPISEIARRFAITPNYVSKLKERAVAGLKKCGLALALAARWLWKPREGHSHAA